MSLEALISNLTEPECGRFFRAFRWPQSTRCLKCNRPQNKIYPDRKKNVFRYYCRDCRIWWNDFTGTILEETRLPLKQWFLAIYLFLELRLTAVEAARLLDINRNTAQSLSHKIRNEQAWCQLLLDRVSGRLNQEVTFLMTLKEVKNYLGISRRSVYRLISSGALSAIKVGGQWRFKQEDIQKYLQSKLSRYGTSAINEYQFFRPEVLGKYRKDKTKYYLQDKAYHGLVGSKQDYQDVQTMGKEHITKYLDSKVFYNVRYRKMLTPQGHQAIAISHKDYQQLPPEEYRHWSNHIIW